MPTQTFPTEIYNFVDVFVPVLAIGIGIAIALALFVFIGQTIVKAMLYERESEPLQIDIDAFYLMLERTLSGRRDTSKPKNDEKLKNDEMADPFDPEPDYVSFEALLAEKPKRKLKNDDLG